MSIVMSSISRSTQYIAIVCTMFRQQRSSSGTVLYLRKTFVVQTFYYCNLLCYVKCSTSPLIFEAVAMSLYHIFDRVSQLRSSPSISHSSTPFLVWLAGHFDRSQGYRLFLGGSFPEMDKEATSPHSLQLLHLLKWSHYDTIQWRHSLCCLPLAIYYFPFAQNRL